MTLQLPHQWLDDPQILENFRKIAQEWPEPSSAWQDYTATVTTVTLGTGGTQVSRYAKIGRTVHCSGRITLGTGGSFTGSPVTISLPIAAAAYPAVGVATANDVGTQNHIGAVNVAASATTFTCSFEGNTFLAATSPFTWGDTDILTWHVTYETAV